MWRWVAITLSATLLVACQAVPPTKAPAPAPQEVRQEPPASAAPAETGPPAPAAPTASVPEPPAKPEAVSVKVLGVDVERSPGTYEPVQRGETLPAQPLTLRVRYAGNATPEQFASWMTMRLQLAKTSYVHPEPGVALVSMEVPPPYISFDVESQGYLWLYTGEPPKLAALDLATGRESVLGEAPTNVTEGSVSPDGRWAVLVEFADLMRDGEGIWLIDLASGNRRRLPLESTIFSGPPIWYGDYLVLPNFTHIQYWDLQKGELQVKESAAATWNAVSSDGRYLAGFRSGGSTGDWIAPATVVIHDLKTRTEQAISGVANSRIHSCWIELFMAWDKDGQALFVEDHPTSKTTRVLRIDRATGAVSEETAEKALPRPSYDEPHLKPSPAGWQVLNRGWGPLMVISPEGKSLQFGDGYPVGWLPDGRLLLLRWPNVKYRVSPMGDC